MSKPIIEKNVPLPRPRGGPKGCYPWGEMEVGDSFYSDAKRATNLVAAASSWCLRHQRDWKFTARKEGGGFRVWRIK